MTICRKLLITFSLCTALGLIASDDTARHALDDTILVRNQDDEFAIHGKVICVLKSGYYVAIRTDNNPAGRLIGGIEDNANPTSRFLTGLKNSDKLSFADRISLGDFAAYEIAEADCKADTTPTTFETIKTQTRLLLQSFFDRTIPWQQLQPYIETLSEEEITFLFNTFETRDPAAIGKALEAFQANFIAAQKTKPMTVAILPAETKKQRARREAQEAALAKAAAAKAIRKENKENGAKKKKHGKRK
jgi:hypothetical protein